MFSNRESFSQKLVRLIYLLSQLDVLATFFIGGNWRLLEVI